MTINSSFPHILQMSLIRPIILFNGMTIDKFHLSHLTDSSSIFSSSFNDMKKNSADFKKQHINGKKKKLFIGSQINGKINKQNYNLGFFFVTSVRLFTFGFTLAGCWPEIIIVSIFFAGFLCVFEIFLLHF